MVLVFCSVSKKSEKTIFYKATLCLAVTYKPPQKPRKQTSPPGVSKLQKKNAKKEGKKKKNQLSLFRRSSRNGGLSFREVLPAAFTRPVDYRLSYFSTRGDSTRGREEGSGFKADERTG